MNPARVPSKSAMTKSTILVCAWLPDGMLEKLADEFTAYDFVDVRDRAILDRHLRTTAVAYGLPPVDRLSEAKALRWIQLISAGVPRNLCPVAQACNIRVTNLAGLYGDTIAEHALCLLSILTRNLQRVLRNQQERRWDRSVAATMSDLRGKTLALVGVGNIGQGIARLARAYGMRVIGCGRSVRPRPFLDRAYARADLHTMLGEADVVAVAAPLTDETEGMLGPAEFEALKSGAIYLNVSRGSIAQEQALLEALRSGRVAAAGLDVFAVEPLPTDHPFWTMPNVIVSPHYSGETVNQSSLPAERFARNLWNWIGQRELEGVVQLERGY
jgi:phosphoglycerate dehydrogenase-like enzyme